VEFTGENRCFAQAIHAGLLVEITTFSFEDFAFSHWPGSFNWITGVVTNLCASGLSSLQASLPSTINGPGQSVEIIRYLLAFSAVPGRA